MLDQCAVTGAKILPVLEAAHVRRVSKNGRHLVSNGLLLRSAVHTLFDKGCLTVRPDYRLEVSPRLRDDFDNGAYYYDLRGEQIHLPRPAEDRPDRSFLEWHTEEVFLR